MADSTGMQRFCMPVFYIPEDTRWCIIAEYR